MTASAAAFGSKTENVAFPVWVPLVLARGRPSSGLHRDGPPDGEHGATLLVLCVVTGVHWPSDVLGGSAIPDKSFPASL